MGRILLILACLAVVRGDSICCRGFIASCIACQENVTVKELCATKEHAIPGCEPQPIEFEKDDDVPHVMEFDEGDDDGREEGERIETDDDTDAEQEDVEDVDRELKLAHSLGIEHGYEMGYDEGWVRGFEDAAQKLQNDTTQQQLVVEKKACSCAGQAIIWACAASVLTALLTLLPTAVSARRRQRRPELKPPNVELVTHALPVETEQMQV